MRLMLGKAWMGLTRKVRIALIVGVVLLLPLLFARFFFDGDLGGSKINPGGAGATTLVVVAHGLNGRTQTEPLVALVRAEFPDSDVLTFEYAFHPLTNLSPFRVSSLIEQTIATADADGQYTRIVLVGHSAGAAFLRKAFVWGSGQTQDRPAGPVSQPAAWTAKVERIISVAGINRGWALNPRPAEMSWLRWVYLSVSTRVARLAGIGGLIRSTERGAPFIADLRVQWMNLARSSPNTSGVPLTIHLLGDQDTIVRKDDSKDIGIAKDTCFQTLQNTDHGNIVRDVRTGPGAPVDSRNRHKKLVAALKDPRETLACDPAPADAKEDAAVQRVIFVMHGIRDHGEWTRVLSNAIAKSAVTGEKVIAVPARYGYFPMAPFLLYADRQRNVRWFMDQYTEMRALYPHAEVDFIGHSNGTYLLASALQRYKAMRVRNVYFAGSVVPQRYEWLREIDAGRVASVSNVVADGDAVVAWFPRLFEQFAEWFQVTSTDGFLDLGAAGFRGFVDGSDPLGRVRNFEFAQGGHGVAVDMSNEKTLDALLRYAMTGDRGTLQYFEQKKGSVGWISHLSNVCWLVWLVLVGTVGTLGWQIGRRLGRYWLMAYVGVVVALINSV